MPPPGGVDAVDLVDTVEYAARTTGFTTDPHPTRPHGWHITWGEQTDVRLITPRAATSPRAWSRPGWVD